MATLGSTLIKGTLTVTGTVNGYTLAAASQKAVDTVLTSGMTSTNVPTSKAVVDYVTTAINNWKTSNTQGASSISMSRSGATVTANIGTTGYFTAGTKATLTVPNSTLTVTNAKASAAPSVSLAKGSDGVGSAYSATKPTSGYYVSLTATPASTVSVTNGSVAMTDGYVAAQTKAVSVTTTTPVTGTAKTGYITLPTATFAYNTTSSGATFIQCKTAGYVGAGSLAPSGTYDKLSYSLSYTPSITGVVSKTSYSGTGALKLTPAVNNFDAGYVGTATDLAIPNVFLPLLNVSVTGTTTTNGSVKTTTKVTGMTTSTSATSFYVDITNAATSGVCHGAATTSLADATNFNGSTRGIITVGSLGTTDTNVGVNTTIDGAASASKKIYIKAGSTSVSNAATGIQTATSGSYHITSTATVTDGYQAAGTKTATTYIKAGSVTQPTASGASTSTSLSGTTITVTRSVTPAVTEGYIKSGTAGAVTTTATVPTETKTASAAGTVSPSSGKLLSSVSVPAGIAKNGYVTTGGWIARDTQVYTLSYNTARARVEFLFNE